MVGDKAAQRGEVKAASEPHGTTGDGVRRVEPATLGLLDRLLARAVFSDGFESGNPTVWSVVSSGS